MGTLLVPILLSLISFLFLLLILLQISTLLQWRLDPARHLHNSGPLSFPLIGCLLSFYKNRRRLLDWYTDLLAASPSQTIVVSRLGARRTIVTANPRNVEYILKTNFTNFPKGKPFTEILGDFLGNGIFNVDGDLWYNQRKLVVQQFTSTSLRAYVERVLKHEVEKKLMPAVESAAAEGRPVDLQELLRRFAFDLVCTVSLGYSPCSLGYDSLDPILDAFDTASDICARRGAAPLAAAWKVKRLLDLGEEKRLREAIKKIHSFVDEIVGEKKREMMSFCCKKGEEVSWDENDLVSKMVSDGIDDVAVRDTMISLIMAGRDTTSAAMTWLFYLLSCHPHVENEVVRELTNPERGDDDTWKLETLEELRWLKACICESMRLFPPVAWDSKHATASDMLPDGTRIRAGDRVTYFPYGMGRMKSLWGEDRFEFKPERWISEVERGRIKALKNYGPYKFPVFQAGPRACPGKEMAFVQMKYVVASIIQQFVIRPVVPDRPVFVPLLTAHMARGFKVSVHRR